MASILKTPSAPQRILIIKMWALGDVLTATPLLRVLKRQYPDSEITWMIEQEHAHVLEGNSYIDSIIPFNSTLWRQLLRKWKVPAYIKQAITMRNFIVKQRFDLVFDMTAQKYWSTFFAVGRTTIALYYTSRPPLTRKLYTGFVAEDVDKIEHHTYHYLKCAAAAGIPGPYDTQIVVGITDANIASANALLAAYETYNPAFPIAVLHPGASNETKRWPASFYSELINLLRSYNVVLTGGVQDVSLCEEIANGCRIRPIVAAGKVGGIGGAAALIDKADVVVTGDTAIMHVSAGLKKKMVAIYGGTRPRNYTPLTGEARLLYKTLPCAPCCQSSCTNAVDEKLLCLRQISPVEVASEIEILLQHSGPARANNSTVRETVR